MAAIKKDLVCEKGATLRLGFRLRHKVTGEYLDLTGYVGRMQVRETIESEEATLTVAPSDFYFDETGLCRLRVSAATTSVLPYPFTGLYDLEIESPAGEVDRIYEGKFKTKFNVTRPDGLAP
jgi:hypothetical protein